MRVLAIDPSINNCGIAVFDGKKLVHHELLHPDDMGKDHVDKSKSMFAQIVEFRDAYKIQKIVIEIPTHWATAGYLARESGSIYKVTFVAGMICSLSNIVTVTPDGWKCQLPKHVVANRLNRMVQYKELNLIKMDHNIVDAIGIGHWYIFGRV